VCCFWGAHETCTVSEKEYRYTTQPYPRHAPHPTAPPPMPTHPQTCPAAGCTALYAGAAHACFGVLTTLPGSDTIESWTRIGSKFSVKENNEMATISEFDGIKITMYSEHGRQHSMPHFHAYYAGESASIGIETIETIASSRSFPESTMAKIIEWAKKHRSQLKKNWYRMKYRKPIVKI